MADEVRLIDANSVCKSIVESIRHTEEWISEAREQQDTIGLQYASNTYSSLISMLERIQNEPTVEVKTDNGWISVDDRLPEAIYDCLVWYSCDTPFGKSKSVDITYCSRGDWCTKHLNGDNIVVLYWMPLPEPPKEDKNETN